MNCNCKDEVNRKVDSGELSQALARSQSITDRAQRSMVRQAVNRRYVSGRFVDSGDLRNCLSRGGWSANQIDFLLYRSLHEHDQE